MKYYSEKLDKLFDSQSDLFKAEREAGVHKEQMNQKKLEEAKTRYINARLEADRILDEADIKVKELYKQICSIYDEANDKASKILDEAKKNYKEDKNKLGITSEPMSIINEILNFLEQ